MNVIALFKDRGWTAIIADILVDSVLLMVSLIVGLLTGIVGAIVGGMMNGSQGTIAVAFVYVFQPLLFGFFFSSFAVLTNLYPLLFENLAIFSVKSRCNDGLCDVQHIV